MRQLFHYPWFRCQLCRYQLPCYRLACNRLPCYQLPCYQLPCYQLPCYQLPCYRLPCFQLQITIFQTESLLQHSDFSRFEIVKLPFMSFYYNRWRCPVLETESDRRQRQSAKGENIWTEYLPDQSPAMGLGINSRNRVWNWVAKLHRLAGRYDNPMPTWFLAPIAGLKLPTWNGKEC